MCPKFLRHTEAWVYFGHQKVEKKTVVFRLPRDHIVFIRSKLLPFALLAYSSQAEFEDNFVVKVYPRYL